MTRDEIFQTMQRMIAEQFAMDAEEITMETSLKLTWVPIPWTW